MPRFRIEPTVIFGRTGVQLGKERLDGIRVEHGVVEECEALVALTSLDNKVTYAREDNVQNTSNIASKILVKCMK